MHSPYFHNANAATIHTFHFPSNLTSLHSQNKTNFFSKARFQCSIKTNTKQVTNTNNNVIILWDLDNKPPRGPPYTAAISLKTLAERFGNVVSISAYTKRHSFFNLPQWNPDQNPNPNPNSILCRVCGYECKSIHDLNLHFKRIHEYQHQKMLNRLKSMKLDRSKVKFIRRNHRDNEAARTSGVPRVGFGLASELRRAGVFVRILEGVDKINAADLSLKKEIMCGGIDWLVLVSDDSGFSEMLKKVREVNLGTVVVGDYWGRELGRNADLWLPWIVVESGNFEGMDLVGRRRTITEGLGDEFEECENVNDEYIT